MRNVPLLALITAFAFGTVAHAQTTLERAKKDGFVQIGRASCRERV